MRKYTYAIAILALFLVSCIHNDVPYPYIVCAIQEIEVEGQVGEAKIDPMKQTVQLIVDEQVELDEIKITKLIANQEAVIIPDQEACIDAKKFPDFSFTSLNDLPANANTGINFTNPVKILLQSYQDYWWTVTVQQVIERTISVENQVGTPIIDEKNRIALVYVSEDQPLNSIKINTLNLEGKNSILRPNPAKTSDFSRPQEFSVSRPDRKNKEKEKFIGVWTVDIIHTKATSFTGEVETWGKKAIVNGGMATGVTPTVEYRKSSESTWTVLDASAVTIIDPTSFKGTIRGLDDGTTYQWRIVVNGSAGNPASFTTERIQVVPNLNFDTWTQNGKNWFANPIAADYDEIGAYWATGNEGVTSGLAGGKDPITIPVDGNDAYKGRAARLRSITGVSLVGAAAGNLFIGKYKTRATAPSTSVIFGRPFTGARPTKLKGYYKYTPELISNNGKFPSEKLQKDQGHIYVKIWDKSWESWNQLDSKSIEPTPIAYGELVISEKVDKYTEFEFDIQYKNMSARPAVITIVATSSRYGGVFEEAKVIGQVGNGSTLWVDEFELLYD